MKLFAEQRPQDYNVTAAISDEPGEITFHIYDAAGVSTADETLVARHAAEGVFKPQKTVRLTRR